MSVQKQLQPSVAAIPLAAPPPFPELLFQHAFNSVQLHAGLYTVDGS